MQMAVTIRGWRLMANQYMIHLLDQNYSSAITALPTANTEKLVKS